MLPVEQIAAHLERGERAGRLQEVVLGGCVVVEDEGEVAGEEVGVLEPVELLQGHHLPKMVGTRREGERRAGRREGRSTGW